MNRKSNLPFTDLPISGINFIALVFTAVNCKNTLLEEFYFILPA
jgi:hypothetical protein